MADDKVDNETSDEQAPKRYGALARLGIIGNNRWITTSSGEMREGQKVIVDTETGSSMATVIARSRVMPEDPVTAELIRPANKDDEQIAAKRQKQEHKALMLCRETVHKMKLDMKVISAELSHDGSYTTYFFTSNDRIDFRTLVKSLSKQLKTRVEMRQIGIRDAARHVGGTGLCGRKLCCSTFLPEFKSISIRMAKDQNLTLNQQKLSGRCGRLRCCLEYEHGLYKEKAKGLPKPGKRVATPDGDGKVRDLDILRGKVRVFLNAGGMQEYEASQVERITTQPDQPKKAKKPKPQDKPAAEARPKSSEVQHPEKAEAKQNDEGSGEVKKKRKRRRKPKKKSPAKKDETS
ncbi:MAG: stage 0 sporulation protein [Deltaproteobacteria bacterium]|jgi:cell fate regulator YaaT (PSP1 superfamily)|nr:stage 0 sporulation protein [Deltaproteobacteria bacterium]MBT6433922.1 stage 0 sporulation protein [Deltaproteobacteria bacterium]MBT6491501.1 stage 0 sporulation protein [Deltaproteobacteria bacterium]